MRWPFSKKKTGVIAVFLCVILILVILIARALMAKPTYVRIVDQASITRDTSSSPGADIRGVTLKKNSGSSFFVAAIASFIQPNLANTTINAYSDANVLIGDFTQEKNPSHLALGVRGAVVVRIDASYRAGDVLTVYEIGQTQGHTAESYEVSISRSEKGPWTVLGTAAGESTFTLK